MNKEEFLSRIESSAEFRASVIKKYKMENGFGFFVSFSLVLIGIMEGRTGFYVVFSFTALVAGYCAFFRADEKIIHGISNSRYLRKRFENAGKRKNLK